MTYNLGQKDAMLNYKLVILYCDWGKNPKVYSDKNYYEIMLVVHFSSILKLAKKFGEQCPRSKF